MIMDIDKIVSNVFWGSDVTKGSHKQTKEKQSKIWCTKNKAKGCVPKTNLKIVFQKQSYRLCTKNKAKYCVPKTKLNIVYQKQS